jgi:MSHA biogenesis protein MshE
LVLSTLHTNDAISTVSRLLDMGAQGFLLAASLHAVIAQRLVRRICAQCSVDDLLEPLALTWVHAKLGRSAPHASYRRGMGCHACNNTGYKGRIGVYELLEMTPALAQALTRGDGVGFAELAKQATGYRPLDLVALDYAAAHCTTVAEAMRVSADAAPESTPPTAAATPQSTAQSEVIEMRLSVAS